MQASGRQKEDLMPRAALPSQSSAAPMASGLGNFALSTSTGFFMTLRIVTACKFGKLPQSGLLRRFTASCSWAKTSSTLAFHPTLGYQLLKKSLRCPVTLYSACSSTVQTSRRICQLRLRTEVLELPALCLRALHAQYELPCRLRL